jgi:2'-5' RNA ligase
MVAVQNEEAQAMRIASGLPPTPPPAPIPPVQARPAPPVPPQIAQGHISSDTATQIGTMIAKLPPDLRAQATVEAHQTLSQSLLQIGKVVTPSGQLEIITKPEQADKVAQRIINDEVARQEKLLAESQKAAATAAEPVAAPVSKFEQGLRARRAVKDVSTRSSVEQAAPVVSAPVVPGEEEAEAPQNSGTASLGDFTPQSSGPAARPAVPSKTGTAALSDLAPTNYLKGDQVVLPDGAKATVSWVSPRLSIVRVKTDHGKVISIGAKQLKSAQQEPVTPAYPPKAEAEPKFKYGSTQANIPDDSEAAKALEMARQRISPSDVAGKGTDVGGNHLTVRYGIKGDNTEGVRKYLSSLEPFEATLGKTDKFPPSEHSDGAAVIHAPVESPELHTINEELEKHGEFTEPSFAEYKPHATVAYVKPDKADRYVGMAATAGKKFPVNSIAITDRNGKQEEIKLQGKPQAAPGVPISAEPASQPTPKKELSPQDVVAKELSTTKEAAPSAVEGGRAEILQSEIKALRDQYKAISEKIGPVTGTYGSEKRELVDKANEVNRKIREHEDELARLRGEPTRAEERDLQTKEAEKPFDQRPQKALGYDQSEQSQHWQVLEPDYIAERFEQKQKTYERAIAESKAELEKAKPGTQAHSEALMNLKFREAQLKRYKEHDRVQALSFRKEYLDLVKKAVSHGSPVPDEVINQHPEFGDLPGIART